MGVRRTVIFFLILCMGAPSVAMAAEHPLIRVAIVKDMPAVTITVGRGAMTARAIGAPWELQGLRSASLKAVGEGMRLNGTPVPGDGLELDGQPALFECGGANYRGVIKVYAAGTDKLLVVNELDIEDYLAGLINSEISSNWPIEAVKAQAVAARTYAMNQIAGTARSAPYARYDVEATVVDQVYHGAQREDRRAFEGVRATTGLVLTRNGVIFPSFYHSACGGYTENARNVWSDMESTQPVTDRFCINSPHGEWFLRIPRDEFAGALTRAGVLPAERLLMAIETTPLPDSPRVNDVILNTDAKPIAIKATELRRLIGYARLKSTWFNAGIEGNDVVFAGRGFGHGAGLCQWGAKAMAEEGREYKDILKHYYRDAEMGRLY